MMPADMITVYQSGAFITVPAPEWLRKAYELGSQPGIDWDAALEAATGSSVSTTTIDEHGSAEVLDLPLPGGGHYVELLDPLQMVAAVWVPHLADWLPFYSAHVTPFLQAHANIEIAEQLSRVGNCLIAYARYGDGLHVNRTCGQSQRDLDRDRELRRARAQPAPWAQPRDAKRPPDSPHEQDRLKP
jgi:hypothetical protein